MLLFLPHLWHCLANETSTLVELVQKSLSLCVFCAVPRARRLRLTYSQNAKCFGNCKPSPLEALNSEFWDEILLVAEMRQTAVDALSSILMRWNGKQLPLGDAAFFAARKLRLLVLSWAMVDLDPHRDPDAVQSSDDVDVQNCCAPTLPSLLAVASHQAVHIGCRPRGCQQRQ